MHPSCALAQEDGGSNPGDAIILLDETIAKKKDVGWLKNEAKERRKDENWTR